MSNEPNKPIPAQELTEKELEGVNGGGDKAIRGQDLQKFVCELYFNPMLDS